MQRTTVRLREDRHRALAAAAERIGRTKAEWLRDAVDAVLARYSTLPKP